MNLILSILFVSLFSSGSGINEQVENYLKKVLVSYQKYEFVINSTPMKYRKIAIDETRQANLNKGIMLIPVQLTDQKGNSSNSFLTVKLKLYKNVLKSVKNIQRGESLLKGYFAEQLTDVTNMNGLLVSDNADLSQYRSKMNIKTGTILIQEYMELQPVINKGDKATLHAGSNGVNVFLDVVARQDGITGEVISVNAGSRLFKAKVIDQYNLSLVE